MNDSSSVSAETSTISLSTTEQTESGLQVNSESPLQQILFVVEQGLVPLLDNWKNLAEPNSKTGMRLNELAEQVSQELREPLTKLNQMDDLLNDESISPIKTSFETIYAGMTEIKDQDKDLDQSITSIKESFDRLANTLMP